MFDTSKVGYNFPPFTIEIERGKIHEFALAIGDQDPIYHDREAAQAAGYADVPLLPTTPTIFWFWGNKELADQLTSLGIDIMRILHSSEEYEYYTPIYPADTLTGIVTVAEGKVRKAQGSTMEIVTFEINYTNQHGERVLKARETLVVR